MNKIGEAASATALFAVLTAGAFAGEAYNTAKEQAQIRTCETLQPQNNFNYCVEHIEDGFNVRGAANVIEFGGTLATLASGIVVFIELRRKQQPEVKAERSAAKPTVAEA